MAGGRSAHKWMHREWTRVAIAVLLFGFASAIAARDWAYRVRPGDTLWDFSAAYLKSGYRWQQLQAHNRIADPYRLPPGSTLQVPITWLRAEPARARVVAVQGSATTQAPGRPPALAVAGMRLPVGTLIETDPDASLTLQFADGSRLLLRADSQLRLDRLSSFGGGAMADTQLRLQRGRITNTVRKLPSGGAAKFQVETPNATSAVRGTVFRIAAGDDGTQAEVLEGSVAVSSGKRKALVPRGYGAAVSTGTAAAIRATKLLPAPNLSALPRLQRTTRPELAWPAVDGAREYRVQVAATPDFASLLVDQAYPEAKAVLPALDDGDYAVRVSAIDAHGLEGRDALVRISVQGRPEPPYAIAPVAGSTIADPQPAFRWSGVADASDYIVEVAADIRFANPVAAARELRGTEFRPDRPLAPGQYYWRVASRDRSGRTGPYGDAIPFAYEPLPEVSDIGNARGDHGAVTFRWQEGETSQRYRFQLSRTADFAAPKIDRIVEEPQISVPRLGGGTWYVRAQTLDADGHAGPFPAAQTVKVPCRVCRIVAGSGLVLVLLSL